MNDEYLKKHITQMVGKQEKAIVETMLQIAKSGDIELIHKPTTFEDNKMITNSEIHYKPYSGIEKLKKEIDQLKAKYKKAIELLEKIEIIVGNTPELNMNDYYYEQVDILNNSMIDVAQLLLKDKSE